LFANPARFGENIWVRFGIFSGVLLAAEFWLVFQAAMGVPILLQVVLSSLAALLPWGLWRFLGLFRKYREGIVVGIIILLGIALAANPVIALLFFAWCSTPWALASYLCVSFRLIRGSDARLRFSLAQLLGSVSWFAAHCGAWRLSFILMLEEYSQLPTVEPQRCFVCTAAARGHPRVVHGEDYLAANGMVHRVNNQLRVLKAFELLLASISPHAHRACRWIYDRIGPSLAAMLIHPLSADVGYFLLKPFEWIALPCLRLVMPGKMQVVYRLYSSSPVHEQGSPPTTAGLRTSSAVAPPVVPATAAQ
jgi:hypothetical protein